MRRRIILLLLPVIAGCQSAKPSQAGARFWTSLQELCGQAFEGRLVEGTEPSDKRFAEERLVMHVAACTSHEVRIPFRAGNDHSRTWILTRTANGLRLKHDHRHPDGSEDTISRYGGDALRPHDSLTVDFRADAFTAQLIPAAATNIWTIAIQPGRTLTYALRRESSGRRFRVEFDLAHPLDALPAKPDPVPGFSNNFK